MNISKGTARRRRINQNIDLSLQNAAYGRLSALQESEELMNQSRLNSLTEGYKNSTQYKKRRLVQERGRLKSSIEDKIFMETVFHTFHESLILDEEQKILYESKLYNLCESTIKSYMESYNLSYADLKRRNGLLENLISFCEDVSREEVKKKFSNNDILNELDNKEDVEISEEAGEEVEEEKESFAAEVVDEVKSRVIETIEREQQIASDNEELNNEIKQYTTDIKDTSEVTTAGEMTGGEDNIDTSEDSEELSMEKSNVSGNAKGPATERNGFMESNIEFNTLKLTKKLNVKKNKVLKEQTLFKNILLAVGNKAVKEATSLNESGTNEVNMDIVFAEAVTVYTLLETLQTIGITQFNKSELKAFSKNLLVNSR